MNQEGNSELEQRSVELSINEVQSGDSKDPVVVDVNAPSSDLAERMENAFDRNLDKLIQDVQAPPPPVKVKKPKKVKGVKVKKVRTVKIKQYAYKPKEGKDASFTEFLTRKVGSSFSLAATARRNAKLAGEEKKPKGYFLKKALGFEFGGDLVNRTRGRFSNDPTAEQDPSLSKGQRFAARLQRPEAPIKPNTTAPTSGTSSYTQPSLFNTNEYVNVVDNTLGDQIEKAVKKLQRCFGKVEKSLSDITLDKDNSKQQIRQENNIVTSTVNKFLQVKESVKENNTLQKTLNTLKLKSLNVLKQAAEKRKTAAKEASLEQSTDVSGNESVKDPYLSKRKGLFEKAWDFIAGNDDEEDGGGDGSCECDDGGPNIDIDIDRPDKKPRGRRPGTRRRWARRKFNRYRPKPGGKFRIPTPKFKLPKLPKIGLPRGIGGGSGPLNVLFAGMEFAGRKSEGQTNVQAGVGTAASTLGGIGGAWAGAQGGAAAGAAIGALFGGVGAAPGALIGGAIGSILGGFGGSAIASGVADKATGADKPRKKMADGGVVKLARGGMVPAMVGEAGPELITPANQFLSLGIGSGTDPSADSIATILGATSSVIESAGPAAAALKPFISQTISPLAKIYGKPELNLQTTVGNNLGNVKPPDENGGIMGLFKKLISFFTGGGGEDVDDAKVPPQPPTPPGGNATDMIGGARLFMGEGFPPLAAAILSGNIQQESGWQGQRKPWVLNDGAGTNKGLISWNRSRIVGAEKFLGKPLETATNGEQVKWIKEELKQYGLLDEFMNPNATEDQLKSAAYKYIGWGDTGKRWDYSKQIYAALLRGEQGTFTASGAAPQPMPTNTPPTPATNPLAATQRNRSTRSNTRSGSNPIVPMASPQQNNGGGLNLFAMNNQRSSGGGSSSYGGFGGELQSAVTDPYGTLHLLRLSQH